MADNPEQQIRALSLPKLGQIIPVVNPVAHALIPFRLRSSLSIPLVLALVLSPIQVRADYKDLDAKVVEYFQAEESVRRTELVREIIKEAGGSFAAVVSAVRRARLWKPQPQEGRIPFETASGERIAIQYLLPAAYDPGRPWPLMLCQPSGTTPTAIMYDARRLAGSALGDFILIVPEKPVSGTFHHALPAEAGDVRRVIREVKRTLHVDDDRVILFGIGTGADAGWTTAIFHADLFAGSVLVGGHPHFPYPHHSLPILLENLRAGRHLVLWPPASEHPKDLREPLSRSFGRAIAHYAENVSLAITGAEYSGAIPSPSLAEAVAGVLNHRRPSFEAEINHRFRYPHQGRRGWLRQVKFLGEIWSEEELSILPSPTVDRNDFVAGVIAEHLGSLKGRIDGQSVHLETRRCAEVQVLFPLGSIDFDKPITVHCNGQRRFHGLMRPSVGTLLEMAYESWDFKRLVAAQLTLSIRSED